MHKLLERILKHRRSDEQDGEVFILTPPEIRKSRRWSARSVLTTVSVLAAMGAALGALWQARLTREALNATRDQITLGRQQYQTQKEQFEDQLNREEKQAQEQKQVMARQLALAEESAKATRDNARASLSSAHAAEQASKFSETSFQTSHRAYVIVESASLESQPVKDDKLHIKITFKNVGQTPALNANAAWKIYFLPIGSHITSLPELEPVHLGNETLGPNLEFNAWYKEGSSQQIEALLNGDLVVIVQVLAVYKDIFGASHSTESCGSWNKNARDLNFGFCQGGLLDHPKFD